MRIAIVAPSPTPFVVGGAEKLWWGMQRYLNEYTTHSCELYKIPIKEDNVNDLLCAYYRFYNLDLSSFDQVISTKYPAFMVRHPEHHLYLQHLLRGCYDCYPTHLHQQTPWAEPRIASLLATINRTDIDLADIFDELFAFIQKHPDHTAFNQFPGPFIRAVLHLLDRRAMEGVKRFYAISQNVRRRTSYFPPSAHVEVIHHPSNLTRFHGRGSRYLFTASRLDPPKRLDLLIRAYQQSGSKYPFLIAGTGPQEEELRRLAGATETIHFLGFVSDRQLEDYYAEAAAVLYAPYDEDYGLITIEALACGKPVVTCNDAGGVTELVESGHNGLIAEPNPESLAQAICAVPGLLSAESAHKCRATVSHISWAATMDALVAPTNSVGRISSDNSRPHLLAVSTYPVYPPEAGGQLRVYHLLRRLACRYRITLLTLVGRKQCEHQVTPYFQVLNFAETQSFVEHRAAIEARLGISAADFACMEHPEDLNELSAEFKRLAPTADKVVCFQPYLYPLVKKAYNGPVIYDAHNMEYQLKKSMVLQADQALLKRLFDVEQDLCRRADFTLCCSQEDIDSFCQEYDLPTFEPLLLANGIAGSSTPYLLPEQRRSRQTAAGTSHQLAIFIGSAHQPNVDAVEQIFALARALPQVFFIIIGSVAKPFQADVSSSRPTPPANVGFAGVVSETEKNLFLQLADVALNPMAGGSGSNLKLAEYIAAGIPVLTTPVGARGYQLTPSNAVTIAPLEQFPQSLPRILNQVTAADVKSAREELLSRYDWDMIVKKFPHRQRKVKKA